MAQFSISNRIEAPAETVFEVATDLQRAAEFVRGIERIELLTELPVGVGTRWRETRRMMGREDTQSIEIVQFDPPHGYTAGCDTCGSRFETTFRFAEREGKTDVTIDMRCTAHTLLARLLSPLSGLLFKRVMLRCLEEDLDDLKRAAEARQISLAHPP